MKETNPKLSICFMFCDKDYTFVDHLLQSINKHIKVPYEILICDNRKDKSTQLSFNDKITFSCNSSGCFIPRKEMCKYINGEYIWFIDVDDDIINDVTPDMFKSNYKIDIISFNVVDVFNNLTGTWPNRRKEVFNKEHEFYFSSESYHLIGPVWWNKIISKELYLHINDIPDINVVCNEDTLVITYFMKFIHRIKVIDNVLYMYNNIDSDIRSNNVSIEKFKRLCIGAHILFDVGDKLFTEEELLISGEWYCREHSCRILMQLIARSPIEIVQQEIDLLLKEFDIQIIQSAIRRFMIY